MSWIRVNETDDAFIANFTFVDGGLLDRAAIEAIGRDLEHLCERADHDSKAVVVDFQGVESSGSALIGKLVLLNKLAFRREIHLRLRNLAPNVYEIFKLTRLNRVFRIDGDDESEECGA